MTHLSLRRWGAAGIALALLGSLTACNKGADSSDSPSGDISTTVSVSSTAAPTTTAPQLGRNPLTGVHDMKTGSNRPIGFVVTDESAKLTQLNLEKADLFFEAETEGGIPRILAVFSSVDRMPDTIGPIRSARPHFVTFAKSLDMIYCHIGGSASGKAYIRKLGVDDLGNAYEINPVLKNSDNFSWNRSAFTKKKVLRDIKQRGYAVQSQPHTPFTFGTKTGTKNAATVDVQISGNYDMAFTYNADTGLYNKHRNSLDTPVHKTHTGGPIAVSNVLVMFDRRYVDVVEHNKDGSTLTRYNFDLKSGSGILAAGGKARDIRWKCTSSGIFYYESDGTTPLTVSTGKTFICLTNEDYKSKTHIY